MVHPRLGLVSCLVMSGLCLGACGFVSHDAEESMSVEVKLKDVHQCSRISPEIVVYNAPRGTAYYEVRLTKVGNDPVYLGGGRWPCGGIGDDSVDVIPEGALVNSYRGPCPPQGQASGRQFRYTVSAMSKSSSTPLAVSNYNFILED